MSDSQAKTLSPFGIPLIYLPEDPYQKVGRGCLAYPELRYIAVVLRNCLIEEIGYRSDTKSNIYQSWA
ncbi:hypothetical protein N7539_007888 [Penicillium diatomitis]|uniref:Uncharacterized protein n=1 Tax=Penicillium diatomitis TaxID=2819901 RepID=A0A9X0BNE6_9EURO|nr:uncharacterized protein N7539_007888 [Penicillium diatomitis]KAJ5475601.1 hypothetical protein N7539_007888 [Penicillium diatomitis]